MQHIYAGTNPASPFFKPHLHSLFENPGSVSILVQVVVIPSTRSMHSLKKTSSNLNNLKQQFQQF